MTNNTFVQTSLRDGVVHLVLNRPERRNAINIQMARDLAAAADLACKQGAVAAVLSGAGPIFCAGIDLKCPEGAAAFELVSQTILNTPLLWVASIEAPCIGGAVAFIAHCHIAVASVETWFSIPEVKHQIYPNGVIDALRNKVPRHISLALALSGEPFTAETAKSIGLLNATAASGQVSELAEQHALHFTGLSEPLRKQFLAEWSLSSGR